MLISATPGPNVFYVTTRSIRFGFGAAMLGMPGCLLALLIILSASVAGVSAFLLAVPTAFEILKIAGAAYLIWLGIQAWRAPVADFGTRASPRETASRWSHFQGGFLVGIGNPKLLVFAAAFFPQFMDPGRSVVAAILAAGGDLSRGRGMRLCHGRHERTRPRALSRAGHMVAPNQSPDGHHLRWVRLRPATLSAVRLCARLSRV